ncbi:MAG: hypothetical protein VKQ33_04155 [Candidatus Sericytochromatia bacterium]|nr:hypothetical protein [Candidatus Sericytochromatia bacterium]
MSLRRGRLVLLGCLLAQAGCVAAPTEIRTSGRAGGGRGSTPAGLVGTPGPGGPATLAPAPTPGPQGPSEAPAAPSTAPSSTSPTTGPEAPATPIPPATPSPPVKPSPSPRPSPTPSPSPSPSPSPTPWPSNLPRATGDRPDDDAVGYQLHVLYAVPAGGQDLGRDREGTIARSVYRADDWLARETNRLAPGRGQRLRLDRSAGALDVTYAELPRPDEANRRLGTAARELLEADLKALGHVHPRKLYMVYYEGSNPVVCGGGCWPPDQPGTVAAAYLQGELPGGGSCADNPLPADDDAFGYWEAVVLHEVFHCLGFVPRSAPHHWREGHTSSIWADLMYAGPELWRPAVLDDAGELYEHARPGGLQLSQSAFLTPSRPGAAPPPRWDEAIRTP